MCFFYHFLEISPSKLPKLKQKREWEREVSAKSVCWMTYRRREILSGDVKVKSNSQSCDCETRQTLPALRTSFRFLRKPGSAYRISLFGSFESCKLCGRKTHSKNLCLFEKFPARRTGKLLTQFKVCSSKLEHVADIAHYAELVGIVGTHVADA